MLLCSSWFFGTGNWAGHREGCWSLCLLVSGLGLKYQRQPSCLSRAQLRQLKWLGLWGVQPPFSFTGPCLRMEHLVPQSLPSMGFIPPEKLKFLHVLPDSTNQSEIFKTSTRMDSELPWCHLHGILLVKQVTRPPQIQVVRGIDYTPWIWDSKQSHITKGGVDTEDHLFIYYYLLKTIFNNFH